MKGFVYLVLGGLALVILLGWFNRHDIDRAAKDFQAYQTNDMLEGLR